MAMSSARLSRSSRTIGRASRTGRSGRCSRAVYGPSATAVEAPATTSAASAEVRDGLRNIAIVAHVDHGKTTLVDAMLSQSKVFRDNQEVATRIMDSNDLERERGITILSKNTAVTYKDTKINIIDTPGHADFGGEVERVLHMCDGVLLLIDSVEGPMPQTRFVLTKALAKGKKVMVVVNKVDRPMARLDYVLDKTFDLFCELGASDEQCDFPVVYASGMNGIAGLEPEELAENLEPLFDSIIEHVPPPTADVNGPLQMQVANIAYDNYRGRICIGRVTSGTIKKGQTVYVATPEKKEVSAKVSELFVYKNFLQEPVEEAEAGDICAVAGMGDATIGETIMASTSEGGVPLPTIAVEEPTVRMNFIVNTSPFAGQEGEFVTSRNLKDRLAQEAERNLALKVEPGETAESFIVSGRGTLHLTILIEEMRREGYEFQIGPPSVIYKEDESGKKLEPYEIAEIEVPEDQAGGVVELLGKRGGQMQDMMTRASGSNSVTTFKFRVPTTGMMGVKGALLTATRGTAALHTSFDGYDPIANPDGVQRDNGSLISYDTGDVTTYSVKSAQERGVLFVEPGEKVYDGQVIGINARAEDLKINVCKKKAANNIRSATKEATDKINAAKDMSLDDYLEFLASDELVEVTPLSVRVRKNPSMKGSGKKGGK